jgi:YesN/AraC family two-component response regulator
MKQNKNGFSALLRKTTFDRREERWRHIPYQTELQLLESIKRGEVEQVKNRPLNLFPFHNGHLSQNPHRQAIYEFVASVTLVTRFAIEGGLETEQAYNLSDAYIEFADGTKSREEVHALYSKMAIDFTVQVRNAMRSAKPPLSSAIRRCIEYIDSNSHYKITLRDLGKESRRNPAYLCVQFKEETGMSVTEYVNKIRVEEAKQLLQNDNVDLSEIAGTLGFCSQSYFTKIFRATTGETPRNYRLKNSNARRS